MAGWSVHDDDFVENVQSLDNLPSEFWGVCRTRCAFNAVEKPAIDIRGKVVGFPKPVGGLRG